MGPGDHDDEPMEGPEEEPAARGAPPDPQDRVWVHPTELPRFVPAGRRAGRAVARRSRSVLAPALAGAAGALVTVGVLALTGALDRGTSSSGQSATALSTPTGNAATVEQLATRLGLSVVGVSARDAKGTRSGSGVCVRHAGEVLTSARLVGNAKTADIRTSDGERHVARVIGRDRISDLVLLSIDSAANVPAAQLADDSPSVGSAVWIMGAAPAAATSSWVSSGMVSSRDAVVAVPSGPTMGGLLETDAVTGSGATGGALVDAEGDVVGIVLGRLDGNGTTYSVPIDYAVEVAEALHANGVYQHGSAGFLATDAARGPTIANVTADGPAARAGVRVGDVVRYVDGRAVESRNDVMAIVRTDKPGRAVTLILERGPGTLKVRLTLVGTPG
jgi:putative serine protease PepD